MKQVGLIGFPVAHSLSPRMQQAAFDVAGIAACYSLWETVPTALPERIARLRAVEALGANVTIPYKITTMSLVDEYDPLAARVGAINTIVNRNTRLIGYNTDVEGCLRSLAEMTGRPFVGQGQRAVLLGTGGAARAAAAGLIEQGIDELTLLGRTPSHVQMLFQFLQSLRAQLHAPTTIQAALLGSGEAPFHLARATLLINATSFGLQADQRGILVDVTHLAPGTLVMDMIFNPRETPLLRAAAERGCRILNGLPMLLHQGTSAFELWTGQPAPVEAMRRALGC